MGEDRQRCLEAGFDGYLVKPIDVASFPAQVRGFIDATPKRVAP
jgi:CheY-like chemotaxis protein